MIPAHLDFKRLKAAVSIESLLGQRGLLAGLQRRGPRLVGACPIHKGQHPHSFVVDSQRNLWYCFSGCSTGGDVVELVRRLDGVSYREAAHVLARLAGTVPSRRQPVPAPAAPPPLFRPYRRRLRLLAERPLLRRKRIRPASAQLFETGYWPHRGFLQGCLGVRLHDPHGAPLGYAGRRLDADEIQRFGKWKPSTPAQAPYALQLPPCPSHDRRRRHR